LLLKALDGLSARAAATAENVANSATPNYRPAEVRFERMLAAAAHGGADAVRAVKPQLERHSSPDGVRLDLELANASTTAMRYAALVELLGRQIQLHSLSISGNR
jgi:flagellar basal-body rod protein FlgB